MGPIDYALVLIRSIFDHPVRTSCFDRLGALIQVSLYALSTVGPNNKNPPKNRFIKFVKLKGYTYACNRLTHFEYEAHAMTGNGNDVTLIKSP